MILVIAEKPSLGRDIAEALPGAYERGGDGGYIRKGEYIVTWVFGHMLTLKEPEDYDPAYKKWSAEALPIYFENWGVKIGGNDSSRGPETKAHRVKIIGELLKQSDMVIHAGDPDEEGQLLIDELLEWFNYSKPVKRLNTGDTTRGGLIKALSDMRDNSECVNEGKSAYARSVADMMVGVNMSRFFTCKNRGALLSVGRVQTPTLGLVVNRDMQIEGHEKCTYYDIFADINIDGKTVTAKYTPKDKSEKILSREAAEKIAAGLNNRRFEKIRVEQKTVSEDPPLPFNLVKLQSYCSSHFGYNPTEVMDITQSLREKHKAITYNRSDCQYLSSEQFKEAPETLERVVKNISYRPKQMDPSIKSKCFNDENITAHTAIIPTNQAVDLAKLTERERNVYLAVCKYYMAQFLPPAVKDKRKLEAKIDAEHSLTAYSTKISERGYLAIFKDIKPEAQTELSLIPAGIYAGDANNAKTEEKETKPPSRYTRATLNEDMTRIAKYVTDPRIKRLLLEKDKDKKGENGSIGTAATRSVIIDGLIDKKYLREEGKRLISTELGRELYRILPDEIKRADMTAEWWSIQEDIRAGIKPPEALTENVLSTIKTVLAGEYPSVDRTVMTNHFTSKYKTVLGQCPLCGGNVIENKDAFGCSNWREPVKCRFVIWKKTKYGPMRKMTVSAASVRKWLKGGAVASKRLVTKDDKKFSANIRMSYNREAGRVEFKLEYPKEQSDGKAEG